MTEQELASRVLELCRSIDRVRMPDHRHTAEAFMAERDQHRDDVRRLYRDITGSWPGQDGRDAGPPRRPKLPVPAAVLRHRERVQRRAAHTA